METQLPELPPYDDPPNGAFPPSFASSSSSNQSPGASVGSGGVELKEMQLASNRAERAMYDNLADLYAIIIATEHLETAYVRDAVPTEEYDSTCSKLIAQFKTQRETVSEYEPDMLQFMRTYKMQCPAAANRLLKLGVPATVEHAQSMSSGAGAKGGQEHLHVAQAVQFFITTMDSLKLEMTAVDQLHPLLNDLMNGLNKVGNLPPDHAAKLKVKDWLLELNKMRASDELSTDQARQMSFDLENAYASFHRFLEQTK